jgi:hypothetical protein
VKEAIPSVTPEMEREYEKLARTVKQQVPGRIGFLGTPRQTESTPESNPEPAEPEPKQES